MTTQLPVFYSAKCRNERCSFAVSETRDANAVRRAGTSHFMDTGHGISYPAVRHEDTTEYADTPAGRIAINAPHHGVGGGKMGHSAGAI